MTSTIITKNSSTASAVPASGDLVAGELALNTTDKKLYTKNASGTVVKVVGSLGNQEASAAAITGGTSAGVAITGGTINNTPIGATTAAAVTGTLVTATTGFAGDLTGNVTGNTTGTHTGAVTGNVTGNLTGNVTASSGSSSFNNVTINGSLDMNASSSATIVNLTAPTNSGDAATKGYVDTSISNLVASAPTTLDTLNEIAAALGNDPNLSATLTTSIATKLPLAGGTMTGNIAMGTNKITGLGTPSASTDAATKAYVDSSSSSGLPLSGGTMTGNIVMGSNKVTSTATPTTNDDLTRKGYVDGILGSATAAATSASNAATSETNAANSASAASSSASAASASASSAAASYDSFDDRYLGPKSSAPTLDNDGNALLTGALYWNSTSSNLWVWNGSAWTQATLTAGSFATLSGTETLTNKTLTTPTLTTPNITTGLTIAGSAGTSGQVLTSGGSGAAPTWSNPAGVGTGGAAATGSVVLTAASGAMQLITSSAVNQTVTLPNATTLSKGIPIFNIKNIGPFEMTLVDGAGTQLAVIGGNGGYATCSLFDNSTASGVWELSGVYYSKTPNSFAVSSVGIDTTYTTQYAELDSTRSLFMFVDSSNLNIYGVVYNSSTGLAGSPTLIRTLPATAQTPNVPFGVVAISSSQALVFSCANANNSTAGQAVVLSISGTTITVNTPVSFTLGGNAARIGRPVLVGTTYIVPYARYGTTFQQATVAITVSGTTPTVGAETTIDTDASNTNLTPTVVPISSSTFMVIGSWQSNALLCKLGTISGTTISYGTGASLTTADVTPIYFARRLSTGRVSIIYQNGTALIGAVCSFSGTTTTATTVSLGTRTTNAANAYNIGDIFVAIWNNTNAALSGARALIDSSGTATAGTFKPFAYATSNTIGVLGYDSSNIYIRTGSTILSRIYVSGGDIAIQNYGVFLYTYAIGNIATYTIANERPSVYLQGARYIGGYTNGAGMLCNGVGLPSGQNNVIAATTFEQTNQDKGWYQLQYPTATTFIRVDML